MRYETRPEVRKETRDFFQAQRDAVYDRERIKQAEHRRTKGNQKDRFLERQTETIREVRGVDYALTSEAQNKLAQKRRQQAAAMRRQLRSHEERRRQNAEEHEREVREKHEDVIQQRFDPRHEPEWMDEALAMRQSLKARSQAWTVRAHGGSAAFFDPVSWELTS